MLAKIDVWFSSRKVQKAMAKISPRYLARSPVNILRATKFMTQPFLHRDPSHTEGTRRAFQISRRRTQPWTESNAFQRIAPQFTFERPDNTLIVFAAWAFLPFQKHRPPRPR